MEKFSHGGQVGVFAKELGCTVDEVIDLSSNINFVKPNIQIDFNNLNLSSYPTYHNITKKLATHYKININQLELFNGASSAIFSLFNHLKLDYCTIYAPAYLEYKRACEIYNYECDNINRFTNINRGVKENSLVVFVNPSTPDGKYYDIEPFLQAWDKLNCTILIDESFLEFTNFPSATQYINKYKKLYILKSMTKFYSCAGVRIGTIISSSSNILNIKNKEPMWKLSLFDTIYIKQALEDKIFLKTAKAINIKNHILLKQVLENSSLFDTIYPSNVNFILAKLKNTNTKTLQNHLKKYKIMVRDCSNFDYLDEKYIRIAVKSESSIKLLQEALKNYYL